MKQLVVLSGKGGTGKTSVSASFAVLSRNAIFADCDVGASNLALLLKSKLLVSEQFIGGRIPVKDSTLCLYCDLCRDLCRFDAIDENLDIDPFACEACGLCARTCPAGAIEMVEHVSGSLLLSETPYGLLVHSELGIGEEYGGRLITEIRKRAERLAERDGLDLIIADGPPGIGCPVISSISGADLALLVTEPSVSAIHDLERVVQVTEHFNIPSLVAVNKYDIDTKGLQVIEHYCSQHDIPIVGWIPFDRAVVRAVVHGRPPVLEPLSPAAIAIQHVWDVVRERLSITPHPIGFDLQRSVKVT